MAALVPAERALSWQLTDASGAGVVRERNWLSFRRGEIRVCASCHGVNTLSQTGDPNPTNEPEALRSLLIAWKAEHGGSPTPTPSATPAGSPTPSPAPFACASGIVIDKALLRATYSKGKLRASGGAVVPEPWQGVAPDTNGVRVTIPGVLDVFVPGGAGWTVRSKGRLWRFDDPTGEHAGIRRIDVVDESAKVAGQLSFSLRMAGAASLPALGAVDLAIRFGEAEECATAHWDGPDAPRPRCVGNAKRLTCR